MWFVEAGCAWARRGAESGTEFTDTRRLTTMTATENERDDGTATGALGRAKQRIGERNVSRLRIAGLSAVLLSMLAAPVAAQGSSCPSEFGSGFGTFINNVFTLVTVGGAIGAGIAAAGAWGMSQTSSDPQKKSNYKEWRNDAAKTGLGLAGFGIIWDTATNLLPNSLASSVGDCVNAFGAMVPVDAVTAVAAALPDAVTLLA